MKTIGIIAEFNPFHNGHKYIIEKLKAESNADYVVVIMSGDFVQRGAPAIVDKFTRTKMALSCGADIVIELPIYYSTGSAEFFAKGAVSILDGIGCVDILGFGSESANIDSMNKIASYLSDEPAEYQKVLQTGMKNGLSFASARSAALSKLTGLDTEIIASSNDILGVEYLKALHSFNSSITPMCIKRIGAGYHDHIINIPLSENNKSENNAIINMCSAEEIRSIIEQILCTSGNANVCSKAEPVKSSCLPSLTDVLKNNIPHDALDILDDYISQRTIQPYINTLDNLSLLLHYRLLSEKNPGFEKYMDVNSDLSDKIIRMLPKYKDFSSFITCLKSKDITYTHISRALIHILLGITEEKMFLYTDNNSNHCYTSYARILGLNKNASPLLKRMQKASKIPVISRLSDAKKQLSDNEMTLLNDTITASGIYDLSMGQLNISEYSKTIITRQ